MYDTRARDEDLRYPGDGYCHAVAGVNVDGAHRDGHRVQRQSAVQSTVQYSTVQYSLEYTGIRSREGAVVGKYGVSEKGVLIFNSWYKE